MTCLYLEKSIQPSHGEKIIQKNVIPFFMQAHNKQGNYFYILISLGLVEI